MKKREIRKTKSLWQKYMPRRTPRFNIKGNTNHLTKSGKISINYINGLR